MRGTRSSRQIGSSALIAVLTAALALVCRVDTAAQEPDGAASQASAKAEMTRGPEHALQQALTFLPDRSAPSLDSSTPHRQVERGPLVDITGSKLSLLPLTRPGSTAEGATESFPVLTLPRSKEPWLAWTLQGPDKEEVRPLSPFSQGTRPTLFPGSRMRGPFEQTYPRPFPGGGQP